MDIVHQRVPRLVKGHNKGSKGRRKSNDSLKVVYISSPMKVKTSASKFRFLVQQLTGKNSDIARYMEANTNGASNLHEFGCDDDEVLAKEVSDHQVLSSVSSEDTPTTSDSLLGPVDNVFTSEIEAQFAGIFSADSFCDPSQLDVLGSYDELL
ncbi:hypothetical protein Pfo_001817 [Paulownia fortunei]|nr:hypothetical protein Pfo_001817 [Paulownia fortunei]